MLRRLRCFRIRGWVGQVCQHLVCPVLVHRDTLELVILRVNWWGSTFVFFPSPELKQNKTKTKPKKPKPKKPRKGSSALFLGNISGQCFLLFPRKAGVLIFKKRVCTIQLCVNFLSAHFKELVKKLRLSFFFFKTYINQLLIQVELPIKEFEEKSLRGKWFWCYLWKPGPSVSSRNCAGHKEGPSPDWVCALREDP